MQLINAEVRERRLESTIPEPSASDAALFRQCRATLRMSAIDIAEVLGVGSERTVRRWEQADRDIPGTAWVALRYVLRDEAAKEVDPQRRDDLRELMDRITGA